MDFNQKTAKQAVVTRSSRGEGRIVRILTGQSEWKLTSVQTGGHYCMIESVVPPGGGVPPHQHPDQEAFYVLEGSLEVARLGSTGLEWFPVAAGDLINVPSDEIHGFRNTTAARARILMTATSGLAAFFEEAGTPIAPKTSAPAGPPSATDIDRVLTIARKYGHRFPQYQA